jgi:hypothetical protein
MRHSILGAVIIGVVIGAMFYFVPLFVVGIIAIMFIAHLLRYAFMGHGCCSRGNYGHGPYGYGHGYHHGGCEGGNGYGHGYEQECGCGHEGPYEHFHGHGHMHKHLFHWAEKIRNMSEEEFNEFKNKMDKGFEFGYRGRFEDDYHKCKCDGKSDSDSTAKKEDTGKEETTK